MIVVPQLGRSLCDGSNIDGGVRAIRGLHSRFHERAIGVAARSSCLPFALEEPCVTSRRARSPDQSEPFEQTSSDPPGAQALSILRRGGGELKMDLTWHRVCAHRSVRPNTALDAAH